MLLMEELKKKFCFLHSSSGEKSSESSNKTSWDKDNILDQIYESKYVRIIIMIFLILYNTIRKCIIALQYIAQNPILWAPCWYGLYSFKYIFSTITLKILKLHNK